MLLVHLDLTQGGGLYTLTEDMVCIPCEYVMHYCVLQLCHVGTCIVYVVCTGMSSEYTSAKQ